MLRSSTSIPRDPVGSLSSDRSVLRSWAFALFASVIWFEVLLLAVPSTLADAAPPVLAAAAGLAAQAAFTAVEASLGVAAWGALGARVRWAALAPALLVVSVTEATAMAVASGATGLPEAWCLLLAGTRAAPERVGSAGASRAFAAFGALAVARLVLAAHAHAALARQPWTRAAALVLAFYLATRLLLWWSLDLLQGRSHEPWSLLGTCPTAGIA